MKKILLAPDPVEGGDPAHPSPASGQTSGQPPTAAPPAASTVLAGTRTERELELEAENQRLAKEKKDREMRINQLEDENRTLKTIPREPARPAPSPDPDPDPDDDDDEVQIGFRA